MGVAFVSQTGTISDSSLPSFGSYSSTLNETNPEFIGGLGYQFTPNLATEVTANYTHGQTLNTSSTNSNTSALFAVMANVTYSF